jgi:hypothetical protein
MHHNTHDRFKFNLIHRSLICKTSTNSEESDEEIATCFACQVKILQISYLMYNSAKFDEKKKIYILLFDSTLLLLVFPCILVGSLASLV